MELINYFLSIFNNTSSFDEKSIVNFIENLCKISYNELESYSPPRVFSLFKLSIFDSFIKRLNSNIIGNSSSKRLGGSIGITIAGNTLHDLDALYKQADLALYKAKTTGKNNYYFYNPSLNAS